MDSEKSKVFGDIPTPFVVLDLDQIEVNCQEMLKKCTKNSVSLRPHVKTHKTIQGGLLQCGEEKYHQNKRKIVVSTFAEAQFFSSSPEFRDILFGRPLGPHQIRQIDSLQRSVEGLTVHVLVDNLTIVEKLKEFVEENKKNESKFSIWIKVDCDSGRCGVPEDGKLAVKIVEIIQRTENLCLSGLYTHSGHSYKNKKEKREISEYCQDEERALSSVLSRLSSETNIKREDLSLGVGATPTVCAGNYSGIATEVHPGNYILFDRQQNKCGSCDVNEIAVRVCTRVISHYPDRNTFLIDAGGTGFHKDSGDQTDWGSFIGFPNLKLLKISQEVGVGTTYDGSPIDYDSIPIGKMLQVYPNHSCMTLSSHRQFYIARNLSKEDEKEIENHKIEDIWCPAYGW